MSNHIIDITSDIIISRGNLYKFETVNVSPPITKKPHSYSEHNINFYFYDKSGTDNKTVKLVSKNKLPIGQYTINIDDINNKVSSVIITDPSTKDTDSTAGSKEKIKQKSGSAENTVTKFQTIIGESPETGKWTDATNTAFRTFLIKLDVTFKANTGTDISVNDIVSNWKTNGSKIKSLSKDNKSEGNKSYTGDLPGIIKFATDVKSISDQAAGPASQPPAAKPTQPAAEPTTADLAAAAAAAALAKELAAGFSLDGRYVTISDAPQRGDGRMLRNQPLGIPIPYINRNGQFQGLKGHINHIIFNHIIPIAGGGNTLILDAPNGFTVPIKTSLLSSVSGTTSDMSKSATTSESVNTHSHWINYITQQQFLIKEEATKLPDISHILVTQFKVTLDMRYKVVSLGALASLPAKAEFTLADASVVARFNADTHGNIPNVVAFTNTTNKDVINAVSAAFTGTKSHLIDGWRPYFALGQIEEILNW